MIKKYSPVAILIVAIIAIWASGLLDFLTLETIKNQRYELLDIVDNYPILSVLIFGIIYIFAVALSLPIASLLTLLGGFLFGVMLGTFIIVVSATLGASIIFLITKTSIGENLRKKAGPFYAKVANNMENNAFQYMFFTRLVPVMPFFIANILPALFDIKLRNFATATFIGIIPGTIVYTNIGRELGELESLNDLISPDIIIAFSLLGLFSLIPTFFKLGKQILQRIG